MRIFAAFLFVVLEQACATEPRVQSYYPDTGMGIISVPVDRGQAATIDQRSWAWRRAVLYCASEPAGTSMVELAEGQQTHTWVFDCGPYGLTRFSD